MKKRISVVLLLMGIFVCVGIGKSAMGADVNAKTEENGQTALMAAAEKNSNSEVTALLLKNGVVAIRRSRA
ncbi:hypothetical protein FACS1894204_12900 [Synergistales bacterium]|nr:hypothetical protein FACS1894204_12900 [Synergistales bacterium]